jgi:hypothetical protein
LKNVFQGWYRRVQSNPEVRDALVEVQQYLEERYLEREVAANTSEQANAFAELVSAVDAMPNAVVLVGNIVVAKHTPRSGDARLFAQSLSPAQMQLIEKNPGILASPEQVLHMLAVATTSGAGPAAIDSKPTAP